MNASQIVPGLVSIIIPAYNAESTVAQAIESCLAQTYKNIEIIVVNDGSKDDTGDVLRRFGRRIVVIDKNNGGVAASRNLGTRAASGEFVVWMDHDDLMVPERIQIQIEVLRFDSSIGLVSSDFSAFTTVEVDFESSHIASYYSALQRLGGLPKIYSQTRLMNTGSKLADAQLTVRSGSIYESLISGNFVHPPTVMIRRSLCDQVGDFDEGLRYNSEYDLIVKIAKITRAAYIEAPLLRYRRSETQLSHGGGAGKVALETVRVLERMRHDDPSLYSRHRALFQHRLASQFVTAASGIGPSDRIKALGLLIHGVRHKLLLSATLQACVRIVVPRAFVNLFKRMRRNLPSALSLVFIAVWQEVMPLLMIG